MEKVKEEMERRDRADSERDIAPLVRPEGAISVDTTGKTVEEVVAVTGSPRKAGTEDDRSHQD